MEKNRLWLIAFTLLFLIFILAFSSSNPNGNSLSAGIIQQFAMDVSHYGLVGTSSGLYYWDFQKDPKAVWTGGEVKKVLRLPYGVFLLTSKGIYFTEDLRQFEERNNGLSFKIIKHFENGKKIFFKEIQDLKDLKTDPFNPDRLITYTKDGLFYTLDRGKNWNFLRNPTTNGIKAVAIFSNPEFQIIFAHPFKGVFYRNIERKKNWEKLNEGLLKYSGVYEEVSDILVRKKENGVQIIASNNFSPNMYELNLPKKRWKKIFQLKEKFATIESLSIRDNQLYFVSNLGAMEFSLTNQNLNKLNLSGIFNLFLTKTGQFPMNLYLVKDGKLQYELGDLWLLFPNNQLKKYARKAQQKKGIYLQAHVVRNQAMLKKATDLMAKVGLNMIVIDMKDDFGKLRFQPQNPKLKKMGQVSNPVPLEKFVPAMKAKNIYLVARLVVFKDKVLYHYNNYEFAVRDRRTGKPWRGLMKNSEGGLKYNSEYWVDPYSEKVWEYNIEIAKELLKRGFDEIQFDYIRFPTDGENLHLIHYPYQDRGMDKEGALISFLKYARENIAAPISIDIYGANGWHRIGARTGQEVEMLQKYVDVICPMYYPSHFSEGFLYYPPYEKRTYRIYYYGSLRNYYIARRNVVIRPYIQAFKMRRSYDLKYYGTEYIMNQVNGVDESVNMGYTFWNSGSDYSILLDSLPKQQEVTLKKKKQEEKGLDKIES